jgi:hypothetical protein
MGRARQPGLAAAFLGLAAAVVLFAPVVAGAADGKTAGLPAPRTSLLLAERILQHSPNWSPTSIYCLKPVTSRYKAIANATQKTYECQWVKQNNPRPWEIDMIHQVYGPKGNYLFTTVASNYGYPFIRPALCQVNVAGGAYRTTCHATQAASAG